MKISLYLALTDHWHAPDVLHRACECRDAGWKVIWLTRDEQPLYTPETKLSGWPEMVGHRPDLLILDNLSFDDQNGQEIAHGQQKTGPEFVARSVFEDLLAQLEAAGTLEVILVCGQEQVSDAWQGHLGRLGIMLLKVNSHRCRHWQLTDEDGRPYAFISGRLWMPSNGQRMIQARFERPESEALLALVCEYAEMLEVVGTKTGTLPMDNRWIGQRMILGALDKSERRVLLSDLAVLHGFLERMEPALAEYAARAANRDGKTK